MNNKEKIFLNKLINKYSKEPRGKYLLTPDSFSNDDIIQGISTLLKKKITMSDVTKKFEKKFAKAVGAKYALMVNSGSSANLLAFFALINPMKKNRLRPRRVHHSFAMLVNIIMAYSSVWFKTKICRY